MFPPVIVGFLGRYWLHLAVGVAVGLAVLWANVWWCNGPCKAARATLAAHDAAYTEAKARQESTHRAYLLVSDDLRAKVTAIRDLPPPPPPETLVKEVIRHVPVGEVCTCPGFSDDFGSVWNAVSRRAARSAEASPVPE